MSPRSFSEIDELYPTDIDLSCDWFCPQELEVECRAIELERQAIHEELFMQMTPDAGQRHNSAALACSLRQEALLTRLEWRTRPHLIH